MPERPSAAQPLVKPPQLWGWEMFVLSARYWLGLIFGFGHF